MKKHTIWENLGAVIFILILLVTVGSMITEGKSPLFIIGSLIVFIGVLVFEYFQSEATTDLKARRYLAFGIPLLIIITFVAFLVLK